MSFLNSSTNLVTFDIPQYVSTKKRKKKTHPPNPTSDYIKKYQVLDKNRSTLAPTKIPQLLNFRKETPFPGHIKMSAPFSVERPFGRKNRAENGKGMLLYQHQKTTRVARDGSHLMVQTCSGT